MKAFIVGSWIAKMDVNGGNTRVGVVTYSSAVAQSFNLNAYSSTDSLRRAISSLVFQSGL